MLASAHFWQYLAALGLKKILLFQLDSQTCLRSPNKLVHFLQYDFLGAPARPPHNVLNGGLSWCSIEFSLFCLNQMP